MVEIDEAKLQELKLKYGISVLDMEEIAGAVTSPEGPIELESPLPPLPPEQPQEPVLNPIMGNPMEGQSALMSALKSGDSSMQDVLGIVIVMDYLERMQERREQRAGGMGGGSDVTRIREEMRRDREDLNRKFSDLIGTFEKTMLGKERDEAIDRASKLQGDIDKREELNRLQTVVDSSVRRVSDYYERELDDLSDKIAHLNPNQQKGFFGELFEELGDELKADVKEQFLSRLRGDAPPGPVSTDEEGRTKINYGEAINRTFDLLEKFAEGRGERPPLKDVKRMRQPDETPSFLDDGGEESLEIPSVAPSDDASEVEATVEELSEEPVEVPVEEAPEAVIEEIVESVVSSPRIHGGLEDRARARERRAAKTVISLEEISGIGPKFAEELRGIGVTDVAALARANPDVLAGNLAGVGVTPEKMRDWTAQAKDRMDAE